MSGERTNGFSYLSFVIGTLSGGLAVIITSAALARPAIERIADDRARVEVQRVERDFQLRISEIRADLAEIKQEIRELRKELLR